MGTDWIDELAWYFSFRRYLSDGGAISHYATDDVEFDEDRNHSSGELTYVDFSDSDAVRDYILQSAIEDSDESNTTRTIPDEINMQNNYFANNNFLL